MYVDRSAEVPVKVMLWLRKICGNCGLRKQQLGCNDSCDLMAVSIGCRIWGTALCWNGGVTGCCIVLMWGCTRTGDVHYHCRAAVRSRVPVTIRGNLRITLAVTNMSSKTQCYQHVYWRLVSCELLNSLSEFCVQCDSRTVMCCRFRGGVWNCTK
jgi:hypothetical protein